MKFGEEPSYSSDEELDYLSSIEDDKFNEE